MTRRYGTAPSDYRPQVHHDPARPEPESALEKQYRRRERRGYRPVRDEPGETFTDYVSRRYAEEARDLEPEDLDERGTAWRIYLQSREASDG